MKTRTWLLLLACGGMAVLPLAAQTNRVAIYPGEDALSPEKLKLVWSSTPGLRYEVKQSTNLQSWSATPGYPAINGPAQQLPFLTDGKARFFQVRELDEQPPAIVSQYPPDGGFAVPRFANLTLQLSDATGLDTNSIRLTVGSLGPFTLANTNLTWASGVLTLINGGSLPLGTWGTNVQATLVAADTLGHRGTNTWSFSLETQPQVVTNLFVFGSPHAQRTGQRIGNIPTAALAAPVGPIPMGSGEPWALALVESNRLVLSYTNTPPDIAVDTYVCNLTPVHDGDIFYRKVISLSNAPASKLLTLYTTNVPLAEIMQEGSASVSPASVIYALDTNSVIIRASTFDHEVVFGSIGINTNQTLFDQGGVTLRLQEAKLLYTPSLALAFENHGAKLQRFEAEFRGKLETALVPELALTGTLAGTKNFDLYSYKRLAFVGWAGVVPIWLRFHFTLGAEVGYSITANATMSTGVRQNVDMSFGVEYVRDRSPKVTGNPSLTPYPMEIVPFTYQISGTASAYATLIPQIDLRVESLVGVYANVDPRVEITGQATVSNGQLTSANWGLVADADLNVGLSVIGLDQEDLPALPPFNLFRKEWSAVYPPPARITLRHQPESQTVVAGDYVSFTVDANYSQPLSYQWFYGAVPIPGKTSPTLVLLKVTKYDAGPYSVRVNAGSLSTNSAEATLAVVPLLTAPELDTQPGDQSAALGAEVTLSVQARGSGPLSYRWTKNGDSLSDGVRLSGSGSNTLHIANVQINDAGNYRVRVSNLSGTVDSSHGRLTVVTNVAPRPGLVWIAPGTFVMGSPASEKERWTDETQHTVTLTKGFYLGKYAVTQGEYLALMGSNPSYFTTRDWNGNAIPRI